MPRRKAADRNAVQHTRTRAGCQTCRQRRIKCGSEMPVCQNCTRKGLQCIRQTTLKWQAEYESQGLAFGRAGVWSKRGAAPLVTPELTLATTWMKIPEVQPYHFIQYNASDALGGLSSKSSVSRTRSVEPRLERPLRLLPQMSADLDASMLTYYVEKLCPLTTLSQKGDSPFITMILPYLSNASSAVLDATLALAARHHSRTNEHWNKLAAELELKATNALRSRIATMDAIKIAQDAEISIITMMLCLYEIVSQCDGRWVVHLKGARDITQLRRSLASSSTQGLQAFVDRFFAFQDAIGRTACGKESVFGRSYWDAQDYNVDAWLGCSPALVSIVCSITDLSRRRQQLTPPDFDSQAAILHDRLGSLQQIVTIPGDFNLELSAQVKSLTANLLLHCALYDAEPSADLVRQHVAEILVRIQWCVDRELGAGLLWCLFVAAVELDPTNDHYLVGPESCRPTPCRPLVLRALEALEHTSVSNVGRIRQVIVEVWQARDDDLEKPRGKPCLNDWDTYVATFSNNISLA